MHTTPVIDFEREREAERLAEEERERVDNPAARVFPAIADALRENAILGVHRHRLSALLAAATEAGSRNPARSIESAVAPLTEAACTEARAGSATASGVSSGSPAIGATS